MKLYEIDQAIADLIDQSTGEITDWEQFEELQVAREDKIEGVTLYIKNLQAESAAIKDEEGKLAERRKVIENKVERMKEWLAHVLDGEKFSTAKCAVSFRKTTSIKTDVEFVDWAQKNDRIDLLIFATPTANKTAIKGAMASGEELPFAEAVEKYSTIIK